MTEYEAEFPDKRTFRFQTVGEPFGQGRQGKVYAIANDDQHCAKIYSDPTSVPDLKERLEELARLGGPEWHYGPANHFKVIAPLATCRVPGEPVSGYIMKRLSDPYVRLTTEGMFNTNSRVRKSGMLTWADFVSYAGDLAKTVAQLHEAGFVIGDLSLDNIFAQREIGRVTIIDADSMQFVGRRGSRFTTSMWRPENASPEVQKTRTTNWRSPESDRFSLSIVVLQLLLEGFSPFAGVPLEQGSDEDPDEADHILRGQTWVVEPPGLRRTWAAPPASILPLAIRSLAAQCFVEGRLSPSARPTAAKWAEELEALLQSLISCDQRSHLHSRHLFACPWCERRELLNRDPYPLGLATVAEHPGGRSPVPPTRPATPEVEASADGIPTRVLSAFLLDDDQVAEVREALDDKGAVGVIGGRRSGAVALLPWMLAASRTDAARLSPAKTFVVVRNNLVAAALGDYIASEFPRADVSINMIGARARWAGIEVSYVTAESLAQDLALNGTRGISAILFSEVHDRSPAADLILAAMRDTTFGERNPDLLFTSPVDVPSDLRLGFDVQRMIALKRESPAAPAIWSKRASDGLEAEISPALFLETVERAANRVLASLRQGATTIQVQLPNTHAAEMLRSRLIAKRVPETIQILILDERTADSTWRSVAQQSNLKRVLIATSYSMRHGRAFPESLDVVIDSGLTEDLVWDPLTDELGARVRKSSQAELISSWQTSLPDGALLIALYDPKDVTTRPGQAPPRLLREPLTDVLGALRTLQGPDADPMKLPWLIPTSDFEELNNRFYAAARGLGERLQTTPLRSRVDHRTLDSRDPQVRADLKRLRGAQDEQKLVWGRVLGVSSRMTEVEVFSVRGEIAPKDSLRWIRPGRGLWLAVVDVDEIRGSLRFLPRREGRLEALPDRVPGTSAEVSAWLNNTVAAQERAEHPGRMLRYELEDRTRAVLLARVLSEFVNQSRWSRIFGRGAPPTISVSELGAWLAAMQSEAPWRKGSIASEIRDACGGKVIVFRGELRAT